MKLLWVVVYSLNLLIFKFCDSSGAYTVEDERHNSFVSGFYIYQNHLSANKNVVFSPLSLRIIYSILYESSIGRTKDVLEKLLFKEVPISTNSSLLLVQSNYFRQSLANRNIQSMNKMYLKLGSKLKKRFRRVASLYNTEVEQIQFNRKSAQVINRWIRKITHGMILQAIHPTSINNSTELIILNALYFKALWLTKFKSHFRKFSDLNNVVSTIKFAISRGLYRLAILQEVGIQVLEIPYENSSNLVFWIILPILKVNLDSIRHKLSYDTVKKIRHNFNEYQCLVEFPIFDLQSELDGNKILPDIFKRPEYIMLSNTTPLVLNELQQKTKIIVNQQGTTAASITHSSHKLHIAPMPLPSMRFFIVNRPFIFTVMTRNENDLIFMGHFVKP